MAKNTKVVEKVTGKVETTVDPKLDVAGGAFLTENVDAIKNATMKKAVQAFAKGVAAGQKAAWDVAKACARMKTDIRKEFGSDERLADFLGFSNKGQFSKVYRTGLLASKLEPTGLTASNAQELLPLSNVNKDGSPKNYIISLDEFIKEVGDDLSIYTQKELRDMVAKYKKPSEESEGEGTEDATTEDIAETPIETQEEQEEVHWNSILQMTDAALNSFSDEQKDQLEYLIDALLKDFGVKDSEYWLCVE